MAYGLYLSLDQDKWFRNDFSSEDLLTGTIYTNKQLTVAKNLTGYTLTVRMWRDRAWGDRFNKTATIVTAASGTFSYAVAEGEMPPPGIYKVSIELTKAGTKESTLNRQELFVKIGPSA
jgi:hypothetical protein